MIFILTSTDTLTLTTSSTAGIDVTAAWGDFNTTTLLPSATSGAGLTITAATTTTIVAAPGAGASRLVRAMTIHNVHASTPNTVTLSRYNGVAARVAVKVVLLAGETLLFDADGGYLYLDGSGRPKTVVGSLIVVVDNDYGDVIVTGGGTVWSLDYTAVNAVVAPVWANVTSTPTTLSGYGITDGGVTDGDKGDVIVSGAGTTWSLDYTAVNATVAPVWTSITSTPTTLSGYGITDAMPLTADLTNMPTAGFKQTCKVLSASNITLATGGLLTVDGVTTTAGMRVLCTGQTAPAENGIYSAATGAWTRTTDADAAAELGGAMVTIERGGVYGGTRWATSWKSGSTLNTAAMLWSRVIDTNESLGRLMRYTTTATAGGTTALFLASSFVQVFTGTSNQSVTMPTAVSNFSFVGFSILFSNKSTGTLTIKAYDASTITTIASGQSATISCNSTAADTSAVWTVLASTGTPSDGDKGDVIVSGSGTVWALDYTAVNATIAPVWANITSKPTTLAGYGITDAQPLSRAINTQTGTTYTAVLGDNVTYIQTTNASAVALTIPPNSSVTYPVGTTLGGEQGAAGVITLTPGAGVTLNSRGAVLTTAGRYAVWQAKKTATDTWTVFGDLA